MNLSRREISTIAQAVKSVGKGRLFVPDEEVFAIVHRVHSYFDDKKDNSNSTSNSQLEQ